MRVGAGVLTLQGKTANITSRNIALKRCISAGVIVSKLRPVPADLPPASLPLLGRFLHTHTDSFNDGSAVRHQPHHQDARIEATNGDSTVDHRRGGEERRKEKRCPTAPHSPDAVAAVLRCGGGEDVRTGGAEETRGGWKVTAVLARCKRWEQHVRARRGVALFDAAKPDSACVRTCVRELVSLSFFRYLLLSLSFSHSLTLCLHWRNNLIDR